MGCIAILGATSQIAKDYILLALNAGRTLKMFSRRPQEVANWLEQVATTGDSESLDYGRFAEGRYQAVLNFVGSGDPARTAQMGEAIFEVTANFDRMACEALKRAPDTKYIFLSSGAAYGTTFLKPATAETFAKIAINAFGPQEYYSVAKLYAEARHRAMTDLAITDVRVFSYFSRTAALNGRFFVTDVLRAIRDGSILETGAARMWRDFLSSQDFFALIEAVLAADPANRVVDAYTKAPVEKFELLDAMRTAFGLRYRVMPSPSIVETTGAKPEYYSRNHAARALGYCPQFTSLENVLTESRQCLADVRT